MIAIDELESLYKRHNIAVKDCLKDKKNYYYVSSNIFKNELTKCFGSAVDTLSAILKASELDNNSRLIDRELISRIEEMIYRKDVDGRVLSKIVLYKIRGIDNNYVLEDRELTHFNPKGDHTIFPVSYFKN